MWFPLAIRVIEEEVLLHVSPNMEVSGAYTGSDVVLSNRPIGAVVCQIPSSKNIFKADLRFLES